MSLFSATVKPLSVKMQAAQRQFSSDRPDTGTVGEKVQDRFLNQNRREMNQESVHISPAVFFPSFREINDYFVTIYIQMQVIFFLFFFFKEKGQRLSQSVSHQTEIASAPSSVYLW